MYGPLSSERSDAQGGKARTERKAAAARANGARGGRPRKQPAPERPEAPGLDREHDDATLRVAEAR